MVLNCIHVCTQDCPSVLRHHAVKSQNNGRYHVVDQVHATPKTVFLVILVDATQVFNEAGVVKVILVTPLAYYVNGM